MRLRWGPSCRSSTPFTSSRHYLDSRERVLKWRVLWLCSRWWPASAWKTCPNFPKTMNKSCPSMRGWSGSVTMLGASSWPIYWSVRRLRFSGRWTRWFMTGTSWMRHACSLRCRKPRAIRRRVMRVAWFSSTASTPTILWWWSELSWTMSKAR
jgi:hypothetical protein